MGRWGGRDSERAGERDRRPAEESREDPSEAASRRGLAVARSEMERLASGGYDAPREKLQQQKDREAYKGYYMVRGLDGMWHVSKDGHHITSQPSIEEAKRQIDAVASDRGYDAGQTYRAVVNGVATVEARDPDHALRKARELFPQRQLDVRIMRGM